MASKDKQNTNLIKTDSPETNEQNIEILVDQPHSFGNVMQKDIDNIQKEEKNDEKFINNIKNIKINPKEKEDEKLQDNIILIDNKNNDEGLEFNLNIDFEQQNNKLKEKQEKENSKNSQLNNNIEKTFSDRKNKSKYFDDINNSSIARKEESNFEYNTNKKSQGSDYDLFKMMNEMGNKNSIAKIKTLESLDKINPFTSINSQNIGFMNRHEENKMDDVLKSISEPEVEEEEKSNDDNIVKNNDYKIKKRLSDDINFNIPIEENNKDKKSYISKDIINTSDNDLNEACIRTNENFLKSKMENSDFIDNKEKDNKNNNSVNKINIEFFFKSNESKNKDKYKEEIKKDIINDIDNIYKNNKLNLVKLNNHEIYNFVIEYNDLSKDLFEYDPDYYILKNKDNDYIIRRNSYLSHNYFSYITTKKKFNNEDLEQKLKKYKKNYNEKIQKLTINKLYQNNSMSINRAKTKILKVNDIENISSFFYNFGIYIPEKKSKIIDENSENEIIKNFTTYRKIYNDGNSFQRSFSYLLLENFILKNQIDNLNYIIYDIKKTLNEKYLDIDNAINILINIKDSYSIDNLMNSFNNPNINIDEVMISYIEDTINKINKIDTINKRKYQEITMCYLKTLSNIFDINIEIFYIEENTNKNTNEYLLTMNKMNIYSNKNATENNKVYKSGKLNDSDQYQTTPTFHLLYFLNSYHIIYTKNSDIDSTLANIEFSRKHFYLPSLPKYNCPKCNKNPSLDVIPYYEVVLCHKCLINYMKDILKNRVISFIKSNFSSIEYFTRPITIKSEIKITFTLYKYITGNYLIQDFEKTIENTCFICYRYIINKTNKIIKLKCQCQICQKCLEEKIKENMGGLKYLNLYEIHTKQFSKCPCDNSYNINELLKYSKNKPNEKDKKDALQRLIGVLEDKCCACMVSKNKIEYFRIEVANSKPHFICMECYPKNIFINDNNNMNRKYGNDINKNKNPYLDLESSNSSLKDNDKDKKFFCNICNTQHIILLHESNTQQKKAIGKNKTFSKCCKKCLIF